MNVQKEMARRNHRVITNALEAITNVMAQENMALWSNQNQNGGAGGSIGWESFNGMIHLLSREGMILRVLRLGFRGLGRFTGLWHGLMHTWCYLGIICYMRKKNYWFKNIR